MLRKLAGKSPAGHLTWSWEGAMTLAFPPVLTALEIPRESLFPDTYCNLHPSLGTQAH